jgi:hypothetical protein
MYPRTSPLTTNFSIRGKIVCDIFRFTVDVIDRLRHRMPFTKFVRGVRAVSRQPRGRED